MPQSAVQPGQQANPNAIKGMPVTRATEIATPVNSSPKSNRPTIDGTTSNDAPVANSTMAVTNRMIRVWRFMSGLSRAVHSAADLYFPAVYCSLSDNFWIAYAARSLRHGWE